VKHPVADIDHLRDKGVYRADAKRPLGLQCGQRHASSKVTTVVEPFRPVLAIQDLSEVSPLSGWGINPYPSHYSPAFACSDIPYPLALRHSLTGVRPLSLRRQWGLPRCTRVPFLKDVGSAFPPAVHHLREGRGRSPDLTAYLLVHACQPLWHVAYHDGSAAVHLC
jgi:hypothetical protein